MEIKRTRLLVIDDDRVARTAIAGQLDDAGYHVIEAGDGDEGLEATRTHRPEVVLCDRAMPGVDGLEYCRRLKGDPDLRATYVAMLTASGETHDKVLSLDAGADDYLVKPVPAEELLARVRSGLRIRQMQRELAEGRHRAALLEMAATVGHEINNPLTALFGHLELLLHHLKSGDRDRMQHHLRQSGAVAGRIAEVAQRLTAMQDPRTTVYLNDVTMVDLHGS